MTGIKEKFDLQLNALLTNHSADINLSPSLIALKKCKIIHSEILNLITEEATLDRFFNFLNDNISYEINMSKKGYHTFYTSQKISTYLNMRLIDFLLVYNFNNIIPKHYLLRGKEIKNDPSINQTNFTTHSISNVKLQFNDVEEFYNFYNTELIKTIGNRSDKGRFRDSIITRWVDYFGILNTDVVTILEDAGINNLNMSISDIIKAIKKTPLFNNLGDWQKEFAFGEYSDKYTPSESHDRYGSDLNKYMLSLNNTLFGNSFSGDSMGESTLKFFLNNYNDQGNRYFLHDIDTKLSNLSNYLHTNFNSTNLLEKKNDIISFFTDLFNKIQETERFERMIFHRISIKKEHIPDYIILTHGYAIPLCVKLPSNFEKYKENTIGFLENYDKPNEQKKYFNNLKQCNKSLTKDEKYLSTFENYIETQCELSTVQARVILTNEWIKSINSTSLSDSESKVVISLLPCEVNGNCDINRIINDKLISFFNENCTALVTTSSGNMDSNKLNSNKLIHNTVNMDDVYYLKYLKYKKKYLSLKSKTQLKL
jgi:hypothetical protein